MHLISLDAYLKSKAEIEFPLSNEFKLEKLNKLSTLPTLI